MDIIIRNAGNIGQVIGGVVGSVAGPVGTAAGAKAGKVAEKELKVKMQQGMTAEKTGSNLKAQGNSKVIFEVFFSFKEAASQIKKDVGNAAVFKSLNKAYCKACKGSNAEKSAPLPLAEGKQKCQQYEKEAADLQKNILRGKSPRTDIGKIFTTRLEGANAVAISKDHEINKAFKTKERTYINNLDSGDISHGNLCVEKKNIEGQKTFCFDLKLNVHSREKLTSNLKFIEENNLISFQELGAKKASALKDVKRVTITKEDYIFRKKDENGIYRNKGAYIHQVNDAKGKRVGNLATVINFEGVGRVITVNEPKVSAFYQDISIEIEDSHPNPAQAAQQMLTLLGMGPALCPQSPEDEARLKLAIVFREHFPQEASTIESKPDFYEKDLNDLRKEMVSLNKSAEGIFEKYIDTPHMLIEESTFGRKEWGLKDMDQKMAEAGAVGLMIGVKGYGKGTRMEKAARALGNMLTDGDQNAGAKAGVERLRAGNIIEGDSTAQDINTGGAKGGFARVVHENHFNKNIKSSYALSGNVVIKMPLTAANVGCHLSIEDVFGANSKEQTIPQTTKMIGDRALSNEKEESIKQEIQNLVGNITKNAKEIEEMRKVLSPKDFTTYHTDMVKTQKALDEEARKLQNQLNNSTEIQNELVKKGGFSSKDFSGFVVSTQDEKNELLGLLENDFTERLKSKTSLGSVSKDKSGNFLINGTLLEDFIEVAEAFTAESFNKKV